MHYKNIKTLTACYDYNIKIVRRNKIILNY